MYKEIYRTIDHVRLVKEVQQISGGYLAMGVTYYMDKVEVIPTDPYSCIIRSTTEYEVPYHLAYKVNSLIIKGLVPVAKAIAKYVLEFGDIHRGVQSEDGVVAADDGRCSDIGRNMLIRGGHAVDAAVATCLCLGVVYPMSSGIGGGAFMVVLNSSNSKAQAFNSRETAPKLASKDMYEKNITWKSKGASSMGVPGEIAGLHVAWSIYGKLNWSDLFQPAIKLARDGFVVSHFLGLGINKSREMIESDSNGLRRVFMPNGRLLQAGDTSYNRKLADTLETLAKEGPSAFYNGDLGKNFVKDVQAAQGIVTEEDLRNYVVNITDVVTTNVMGFTILGMPVPSTGILGISMVLNILSDYGPKLEFIKTPLGLHRLIEALKHMLAYRMNLGDPYFVDIKKYQDNMLCPSFAAKIREKIKDDTTLPTNDYLPQWEQLDDHGTTHFSIVDKHRNVVSMTATINHYFGAGVLSPSTGIILNNQMDDFSAPNDKFDKEGKRKFPPAPSNYIEGNKRPLSSMSPLIILKEDQLVGVLGASGGINIIPAVIQVLLNHFINKMDPLSAVKQPRVYHKVVPNEVLYENWTVVTGEHIQLSQDNISILRGKKHNLTQTAVGAICQFVVQKEGILTAVSDPRKGGRPAAVVPESSHPYFM
ncbi:glutathione hydrolase 3-like [Papaver somniferum]|nr:glutathione hydrolase 3-like [Papaver somniferum]